MSLGREIRTAAAVACVMAAVSLSFTDPVAALCFDVAGACLAYLVGDPDVR